MTMAGAIRAALVLTWLAVLGLTPFFGDNYIVRIAVSVVMFSVMAQAWNFIGGFAGYPSLAAAAFFGLGAYAGAIAQREGVPLVVAWILAMLAVTIFAAVFGAIILRLRGHYFAVGSIAMVELLRLITSSWSEVTGGGDGLNVPFLRGAPDAVLMLVLYSMLSILVLTVIASILVDRSRLGFGLRCIQQNEDAADAIGIDTTRYKIAAFTLSSIPCGAVGAIYASWVGYIDPTDSFSIVLTIKVVVMALLGGAGTVFGPLIGAAVFVILEELFWSNFLVWNRAILGAIIVALIIFLPRGVIRLNERLVRRGGTGRGDSGRAA